MRMNAAFACAIARPIARISRRLMHIRIKAVGDSPELDAYVDIT